MNKALKGNQQEIIYTKQLNKNDELWSNLEYDFNNTYAIHITSKKFAKVNEAKIDAKADIYFAKGFVPEDYLINNDYYLKEKDLKKFNLSYIPYSGTSIKLPNSRYTIVKISANTFKKIFGDNILAAGASIYCLKEKDFIKNEKVINGWGVKTEYFIDFFEESLNFRLGKNLLKNKDFLQDIKTYSNNEISDIINNSTKISNLIFKGIGNFEEPYTAHWIIENNVLKRNYFIPFTITTGSGRSKGTYTIVLKPR